MNQKKHGAGWSRRRWLAYAGAGAGAAGAATLSWPAFAQA
jgi:hypothetical protein